MTRVAIVSHFDLNPNIIDLPMDNPSARKKISELYRWNRVEFEDKAWDEMAFLGHILGKGPDEFSLWEMPIFSGVHLENIVKKADSTNTTKRINFIPIDKKDESFKSIDDFNPDLILVSTTFILTLNQLIQVAKIFATSFPNKKIIFGGNHVFRELFIHPDANFISEIPSNVYLINSRYGEQELNEILTGKITLDNSQVIKSQSSADPLDNNITYKDEDWLIDFDLINYNDNLAQIRTAVGCAFHCAFCSYPVLGGIHDTKEIDSVIEQIKVLKSRGVKHIPIFDDTLNVPPKRFEYLLDQIIENELNDISYYSFVRCQFLTDEVAQKMKRAGWKAVILGIESGNDNMLRNMEKTVTTKKNERGVDICKKNGILTFCTIIMGYPGETPESIKDSVNFLNNNPVDFCVVQPFYYLHNSPIHQKREKYKLTGRGLIWSHETMNSSELQQYINQSLFDITTPIYSSESACMWELIYILYKGYDVEFYRDYRKMICSLKAKGIKENHDLDFDYSHDLSVDDFVKKYR
ncbi:MAG: radical SAM protein [Bacteriovoracaceae bacterium]|nr:radical SAM protein [Bacteriovoracaceae bacterium]